MPFSIFLSVQLATHYKIKTNSLKINSFKNFFFSALNTVPTKIERALKYKFNNPKLLAEALTKTKQREESHYERLEFLGDAVLGKISVLIDLFPIDSAPQSQKSCGYSPPRKVRPKGMRTVKREAVLPPLRTLQPQTLKATTDGHLVDHSA